jgi:uncharacterized membrane protein
MTLLIAGLLVFLGVHSVRIFAEPWRSRIQAKLGEGGYKGLYSVASIAGFALLIWGYGVARAQPTVLWVPPLATRHVAALLMLPSFVLLAAAYVPGNRIKARLGHPMVLGVKLWALAHLLANGTLADVLLFGGFLLWAVLSFRAARGRDRAAGTVRTAVGGARDAVVVAVGIAAWVAFAFWLHRPLIGVAPFS